jgi:hypothetical protein
MGKASPQKLLDSLASHEIIETMIHRAVAKYDEMPIRSLPEG